MPGIITVVQVVEAGKLQIHSLFQDNISLNKRDNKREQHTRRRKKETICSFSFLAASVGEVRSWCQFYRDDG
jgi:hypothetical protein